MASNAIDLYPTALYRMNPPEPWSVSVDDHWGFKWEATFEYEPEWPGRHDDDVKSVKNEFILYGESYGGRLTFCIPEVLCARQSVPEPDYRTTPPLNVYDTIRDVIVMLRTGWGQGISGYDWLGDWVERHRVDRWADTLSGIGPARSQKLYDRYGTISEIQSTPFDELDDAFGFMDRETYEQMTN